MNTPKNNAMEFDRTGIILYTINYKKCVAFYRDILELPKLFETDTLTCFSFGAAYLMIEEDDQYNIDKTETVRIKTCLRFNTPNVRALAEKLMSKNIPVDYQEHTWGIVAKFSDPDGNLCAIKDSELFEKQIAEYKSAE